MRLLKRVLVPGWWTSLRCLWRFGAKVSPRAEIELSRHLAIGKGTRIGSFTKIKSADGPLRIGPNVSIATGCFLSSHTGGLTLGADTLVGPNVSILPVNYSYERLDVPFREQGCESKGITIGDNVWIGAGVCIVDGAAVGNGVIIAPNSVVSGKIEDNAIAQGNPAKVVFVRR